MAIKWTIQKCTFYLLGLPSFQVWTDHRPLVGIFQKDLPDINNPRQLNFREKIQHFNFEVQWVAGKTYFIVDALSRFPVFKPDFKNDDYKIYDAVTFLQVSSDPGLEVNFLLTTWQKNTRRYFTSSQSGRTESKTCCSKTASTLSYHCYHARES